MSNRPTYSHATLFAAIALVGVSCAAAFAVETTPAERSITDTSVQWPTWQSLVRVLTLRDYNTRVVVAGTSLLGLTAGLVGTFLLLRKRALMGDALSHATLPGIGIAFMVLVAAGGSGKYLPVLLLGAAVFGVIGLACVLAIRNLTRIKEDAALAVVLSVFFGLGVAVLGIIQKMDVGHAAGLESFIYGKTASMLAADAKLIAVSALVTAFASILLFKEFFGVCFDQEYVRSQGWSIVGLDVMMLALVTMVTVIGLQAVGLILMIALLVIPPAAARFWTHHLPTMLAVSAGIGAASGMLGAAFSALVPRLPAGAIIVVTAAAFFTVSFVCGPAGGAAVRLAEHVSVSFNVARQHLLRAMFEWSEPAAAGAPVTAVPFAKLESQRTWSPRRLRRLLRWAQRRGYAQPANGNAYALTPAGLTEARRVVRNHRLWELYLITHADIAPSHVDRDADQIEHVLGEEMVEKLESILRDRYPHLAVPPSPHRLDTGHGRAAAAHSTPHEG